MAWNQDDPRTRARKCGHWTRASFAERQGVDVYYEVKHEPTGELKKDGAPTMRGYREYYSDAFCARCNPKTAEESAVDRDRRERKNVRARLRKQLTQRCPECGEQLRPRADSTAFDAAFSGQIEGWDVMGKILVAHFRHEHTDYEIDIDDEFETTSAEGYRPSDVADSCRENARIKSRAEVAALIDRYRCCECGTPHGSGEVLCLACLADIDVPSQKPS